MIRNSVTAAPVEIIQWAAAGRLRYYDCRCGPVQLSRQPLKLDIAKPTIAAMILETYVSLAGMVLVSHIELVRTAVGPLVRLAKFVEINL